MVRVLDDRMEYKLMRCIFATYPAIVAWRVYAIYNGQRWICRLLWIAGSLNFAIAAGISTASLIPIICECHCLPVHCPSTQHFLGYADERISADLRPFHHACVGNVCLHASFRVVDLTLDTGPKLHLVDLASQVRYTYLGVR